MRCVPSAKVRHVAWSNVFDGTIRPANFRDVGTIAQLTLPYVYWRLMIGGVQNQFNSAMPQWVASPQEPDASTVHSYDLTSEEAWKVIMYLYDATGYQPRRWETHGTAVPPQGWRPGSSGPSAGTSGGK